MANVETNVTRIYALKKFCKIAGRENAAVWALKKYLGLLDELLVKNCYNCELIEKIRCAISRKANLKARYTKIPQWERLVSRVKRELKEKGDGGIYDTLGSWNVENVETIPAKKGMQKIEINIKDEPEYHSPHVHIVYGNQEATILLSNPDEIFEGDDLDRKVVKIVTKLIKKKLKQILKRYYEKNPTSWKK